MLHALLFFTTPAPTQIYTLSLHDALPISTVGYERKFAWWAKHLAADDEQGFIDQLLDDEALDRKSTRLNSSHVAISYAVFCLKKKRKDKGHTRWLHGADLIFVEDENTTLT